MYINTGIIGYGRIGRIHDMMNRVTPTFDREEKIIVQSLKIYTDEKLDVEENGVRWVSSPDEIFEDEDIAAVNICTPNFTHYKLALDAINTDKAIYLEKPLGLNYEEACNIANEVKQNNNINQVGLTYRFMPGLNGIKEFIQDGLIGDIISFQVRALHSGYLNKNRPIAWNLIKSSSGGGPILDLGIHLFDAIRYVIGETKEVSAVSNTIINKRPKSTHSNELINVDVEDMGHIRILLENSGFGTVDVSRVASIFEEETTFEIMGDKGSLKFDVKNPWTIEYFDQNAGVKKFIKYKPKTDFGKRLVEIYPSGMQSMGWFLDAQYASLYNFYSNIAANKNIFSETPDFNEAKKAQAIVEACYKSIENQGMFLPID